ncbi:MAG: hypothetical protein U1E96_08870 [Azonexus sp.]
MTNSSLTITAIRDSAQRLAVARREAEARASALEAAISNAVSPLYEAHRAGIDAAAAGVAAAQTELQQLIDAAPQLFARPRSIIQDGVKCGYRKQDDALDWDDEATVIARIRALPDLCDMAGVLIRTVETLNVSAAAELDASLQRRIGVRTIPGIDQSFISYVDSDIEKMVKAILADASKRQGDDEAPKAKKAKAKAKEAAR